MSEAGTSSYAARAARKATQIKQESQELLQSRNVAEGEPIMAEKPLPSNFGRTMNTIRTNMFAVKFANETRVFRYDLTVTGYIAGDARFDFTRRAGSDVQIVDRKEKCRAAFDLLVERHADVMPSRENCVYDLQAILFTFKEIVMEDRITLSVPLTSADMLVQDARGRPMFAQSDEIRYTIKAVKNFNLILSNETVQRSVNINLEEQDSDLQQFIEILTSQHAFADDQQHVTFQGGRSYLMNPQAFGFGPQDFPDLGRGAYLAIGAQKSCKIIEGPERDSPRLAVVVENKKTPFHAPTPVVVKLLTAFPNFNPNNDLLGATRLLKDLWVMPTHVEQQDFKIYSLESSARNKHFTTQDGQEITVEQYFAAQYNIVLQHPTWPLLVAKSRDGRQNFYPMEVCDVVDNQRLTSSQLTPDQTATIIKTCARPPIEQVQHIERNMQALNMDAGTSMEAAAVQVNHQPVMLRGLKVPHPQISFTNSNAEFNPSKAEWRPPANARFLLPARVENWALYITAPRRQFSDDNCQTFVKAFIQRCRQMGIQIGDPIEEYYVDSMEVTLHSRFEAAFESGIVCNLIMIISDRKDTEIHSTLKSLEQKFDIVTQNVTVKTAMDSCNQGGGRLTLANVVNKTNLKCGGLNYAVYPPNYRNPLGEDDLFIGFAANHPGGYGSEEEKRVGGAPSVIGYAANDLEHPCAFSGDYVFGESRRDEKVGVIDAIVKLCVERFRAHRGKYPKRIFAFRNGCSEGQFPSVLRYEVPLILDALKKLKCNAGFTLIVPNRMHNVRLTPSDPQGQKAWEQNLHCGTAIDSVINHPKFFDYYLLSHVARQGTAKVPRYTVLYDSNKLSSNDAMLISYCLCFEHQIINGPTSFPTPVYIANRYAERGRMIYNVFQRTELANQAELPGFDDYNQHLTYIDRSARNVRFNA